MTESTKPLPRGFTTREASEPTREASERPRTWQPPQLLPDPKPEPGFTFRWVRISSLGNDDPMNISAKLREGWEPVKASDHPEVGVMPSGKGRYPDSIEIGGLMLMKIPAEFMEQRAAHYRELTESQMKSVNDNLMRESDPRMPLFKEHKTEVTKFGRGS